MNSEAHSNDTKVTQCEQHTHPHDASEYNTPQNRLVYYFIKALAGVVARVVFKRRILRNEIKGKKGPFVIIANHQAALDFVNLMGATGKPMTFVISNSFYNTLPCPAVVSRIGMIPKQQFQTSLKDIHKMKAALDEGKILVIYPTGLMSEDGTPTPTPVATYGFLKWLKCDVYMAKTSGTYFSMPKWRKGGMRSGRTYLDVYKLFDKDELASESTEAIKERCDEALFFDAYEEQEKNLVKYKNNNDIEGLENILYMCPHCKSEFSVKTKDKSTIYCENCGYTEVSDEYAFLHKTSEIGEEIRYPSRWNKIIFDELRSRIEGGELKELSSEVEIKMIPEGKHKFETVGSGTMTLDPDKLSLKGAVKGAELDVSVSTAALASLPFRPGTHIEIQDGNTIYRCAPSDPRLVIKFSDMLKIFYEMQSAKHEREHEKV